MSRNPTLDELATEHVIATAFDRLREQYLASGHKPPSPDDVDTIRRTGAIARAQLAIDEIDLALEGGARRVSHELEQVQELQREAGTRDEYGRPLPSRMYQGPGQWWLGE